VALALCIPLLARAHHPSGGFADSAPFLAAFLFGLLGSVHCAGMCGPLVTLYASALPGRRTEELGVFRVWQHILFHLGRATGYGGLGAMAGMTGSLLAARFDIEGGIGLAAGLFVVAMGLHFLGRVPGVGAVNQLLSAVSRLLMPLWRGYRRLVTSLGILGLGFVQALLPCPLLYVLVVSAASMPDAYDGFQLALSFAVGTTPALWGLAAIAQRVNARRRAATLRATGGVVMAWGLILLAHSLEALRVLPRRLVPDVPLDWLRGVVGL
jgi:sulfite exporter TauE/SafE